MKAKGLRSLAWIIIGIGVVAGVMPLVLWGNGTMEMIALGLTIAISIVIACVMFAIANHKEKAENFRAYMEVVEDASVLDSIEEPVAIEEPVMDDIILDDVSEYGDVPEFLPEDDTDLIFDPIEEEEVVEAPKSKYQQVRDFVVEKTPITNEQIDKAEKIGKVAIPVAAVATVVLMAAKLSSYRKNEIRRRTFFDWLN